MKLIALDIGKRRTGVAYGDSEKDVIIAIDTIEHANDNALLDALVPILKKYQPEKLIIGLPYLLDGTEGSQVAFTKDIAAAMENVFKLPIQFIDERYTSGSGAAIQDPDAMAACAIMDIAFTLEKK